MLDFKTIFANENETAKKLPLLGPSTFKRKYYKESEKEKKRKWT